MKESDAMDPLLRRAARADDTRPPGTCLDAETLAAWADGALPAAERTAVEAHVADCDRCLAMAGALATTAPPASARPTWSPIRWLVPLTTAALAVTAWLVVRPADPPTTISTAPESDAVAMVKPADPPQPVENEIRERAESRRADAATPQKKAVPPVAEPAAPPAAAAAPVPQAMAEFKDERPQVLARSAQLSGVVLSPDPAVRWRLRGSVVERTTDGGVNWVAQNTGMDTELLAGASPSREVAWIVGRRGTVLRSTDGMTWDRLPFPERAVDLVAVTAEDAGRATVTTSDGRTYVTSDGGRTWSLQENPRGPF